MGGQRAAVCICICATRRVDFRDECWVIFVGVGVTAGICEEKGAGSVESGGRCCGFGSWWGAGEREGAPASGPGGRRECPFIDGLDGEPAAGRSGREWAASTGWAWRSKICLCRITQRDPIPARETGLSLSTERSASSGGLASPAGVRPLPPASVERVARSPAGVPPLSIPEGTSARGPDDLSPSVSRECLGPV